MKKALLACGAALGLTLGLAAPASAVLSPATPSKGAELTLHGTVRTMAMDILPGLPGGGEDVYQQYLEVGDKTYRLEGAKGTRNTQVQVTGTLTGDTVQADSVSYVAAASALPTLGTSRVLVMLAHWNVPDSVTQASANTQMFTDTNGYLRDASYGASGIAGAVTPWMKITGPAGGKCRADADSTMSQAKTAAAAKGYVLSNYDNFVLYSPNNSWQVGSDCNEASGWAYTGAANTWLNGRMDRRSTTHELGHNMGLNHAHSYLCSNGISGDCRGSEYGDDFDAMGGSNQVGHFGAAEKDTLGWMSGRVKDLTVGGTTTIAPLASDAVATQGVKVVATGSRTYWAEYRQPVDYDSGLAASGTDGLLIKVAQAGLVNADAGTSLLDVRTGDAVNVDNATLRAGGTWLSPEGYRFRVGTVTAAGAALTVTKEAAPACPDYALEPDNTATTAKTQAMYTSVPRALCVANDDDWTKFSVVAGQTYQVETQNTGGLDTVLSVYKADGTTLVGTNDDRTASDRSSLVSFTPTAAGTYLVKVNAFGGGGDNSSASTYSLVLGETTNPDITAVTPTDGATGVPVTANATVTFTEAIENLSTSNFTLTNDTTGAAKSGTVTRNGTTNQWILNPDTDLTPGNRYTAQVWGAPRGPSDLGGNYYIMGRSWSFTVGGSATDTTAPTITTRTPVVNATSVGPRGQVAVTFSEAVTGVNATTFAVSNATTNGPKPGTVARVGTTNQWIYTPGSDYYADNKYKVTLTGGASAIKDAAGNPLVTTSWTFTVGAAPTVTARTPVAGATAVPVASNLSFTFSEPVTGVDTVTVTMKNLATGGAKFGTVTRVGTTNQWMLDPREDFYGKTTYTVTLTGGTTAIRDLAGNPLATTSWNITTA